MNKRKYKHLTVDDLLNSGSSDTFAVEPDKKGKPRVIRKKAKQTVKTYELYANESELKKAANDLLERLPGCMTLKTDNGARLVNGGRRAKSRTPGMSDQHLCIKGRFVAIEAKMPGKDLDKDQVTYRGDVLRAGGIFITYHSIAELQSELARYRLINTK